MNIELIETDFDLACEIYTLMEKEDKLRFFFIDRPATFYEFKAWLEMIATRSYVVKNGEEILGFVAIEDNCLHLCVFNVIINSKVEVGLEVLKQLFELSPRARYFKGYVIDIHLGLIKYCRDLKAESAGYLPDYFELAYNKRRGAQLFIFKREKYLKEK